MTERIIVTCSKILTEEEHVTLTDADKSMPGGAAEIKDFLTSLVRLLGETFTLNALAVALGTERTCAENLLRQLRQIVPDVIHTDPQLESVESLKPNDVMHTALSQLDENAKMRVLTLLGSDLELAERKLYVEGQNAAYSYLEAEWPNMKHVIMMDNQCTEACYEAYLKMTLKADKLLVRCHPSEAIQFYSNMAAIAERYGRPEREQAVLQGLMGMAMIQGSGTNWEKAMEHFQRALPVLEKDDPPSVELVRLLCDMGFAYFRMNKLEEADEYMSKGLDASKNVGDDVDELQTMYHLIRARSNLALPAIFRGQWANATAMLEESLGMCQDYIPHHPIIPTILNSLGLVFERSDKDQDKALEYYKKALEERRQYAGRVPEELVPQLNNIGMQYRRRGDFETALRYLEEAAEIRSKVGRMHYFTALTEQHLGFVRFQKGDYERAEHHLREAAEIYAVCTPHHDIRGKVELCLAHVYLVPSCRDLSRVRKHLEQVCELAKAIGDNFSDDAHVVLMNAVEHLLQMTGWRASQVQSYVDYAVQRLDSFSGELLHKMNEHRAIVNAVVAMENAGATEEEKKTMTSRISSACYICCTAPFDTKELGLWQE